MCNPYGYAVNYGSKLLLCWTIMLSYTQSMPLIKYCMATERNTLTKFSEVKADVKHNHWKTHCPYLTTPCVNFM